MFWWHFLGIQKECNTVENLLDKVQWGEHIEENSYSQTTTNYWIVVQSPSIILVITPDFQPASSTDVHTVFEDILILPLLASHLKIWKISIKCNFLFLCFTGTLLTHQEGKGNGYDEDRLIPMIINTFTK